MTSRELRHAAATTVTTSEDDLSIQMQGRANIRPIENPPKPSSLIGRLKKRMIAVDRRIGLVGDIIDVSLRLRSDLADSLDVRRGEKQTMGIDVAFVDEAFRLLGAAAGIARIHKTTLVVHKPVQIATCSGEALPEVVGGHVHDFAAHGVTDAEDLSEREDQPLPAIKTEQHSGRAGDLGFFDQQAATSTGTLFGSGKSRSGVSLIAAA